ncbi:MAG: HlyD family efflux transporter periplasmic adaptor subunit [Myxococcales bacterium]|nr:HlyD family efflux transporter periplasmic adaptor subunit [Myxococcales bacterium]
MDVVRKPTRRNATRRLALWAAAAVALVGSAVGLAKPRQSAARHVDRTAVWTETVQRGDLVRQVLAQGTLVPEEVRWLSAECAARVKTISVRPGETVSRDSVVLVLENSELELAALEAERAAATANSQLIQLDVRTDIERRSHQTQLLALQRDLKQAARDELVVNRLEPNGLVSAQAAGTARDSAAGLRAQVESERALEKALQHGRRRQLAAQRSEGQRLQQIAAFRREQLAALEVKAGIAGVVQEIPLESGQWVAIGTTLAKVAKPDRLKAEVRVSQQDAGVVHRGMKVRFESPAGEFGGHVERVDPAVVSGGVRVEVTLDGQLPEQARVDQSVTAHIEVETLHDVLFVSRPSGVQESSAAPLYRLRAGGDTADRVTARLGRASNKQIEIQAGLQEGDEVIVSDTSSWESAERVVLD